MKSILLVIFVSALTAQAQQSEEAILGYTQDVRIKDKVFELYQTPKGDNVLLGKEAAKKHGVYFYNAAKDLLTLQGGFEVASGVFAHHAYMGVPESAFDELKVDGQTYSIQKQNYEGNVVVGWRPTFYRHVRVLGDFAFFPFQDIFSSVEPEPQNGKISHRWLKLSNQIYTASFDHDILIIPAKSSFHAVSLGYFVTHAQLQRFNDKKNGAGWEDKEASLPWNDSGPVVNYRVGIRESSVGLMTVNVQGQFGTKGTKRVSAGLILSIGGRK